MDQERRQYTLCFTKGKYVKTFGLNCNLTPLRNCVCKDEKVWMKIAKIQFSSVIIQSHPHSDKSHKNMCPVIWNLAHKNNEPVLIQNLSY